MKFRFPFAVLALCDALISAGFGRMVSETQKRTDDDTFKKFRDMCEPFKIENKQYAVLWVGERNYGREALGGFQVGSKLAKGDFFVAASFGEIEDAADNENAGNDAAENGPPAAKRPRLDNQQRSPSDEHTEVSVLNNAVELIKRYRAANPSDEKPHLYLYTRRSPCCYEPNDNGECSGGCSSKIPAWVALHKEEAGAGFSKLTVAWDMNYVNRGGKPLADKEFITGLYTLLKSEPIEIYYREKEGFCLTGAKKLWLQKEMYNCIIKDIDASVCKVDLSKNLARLVNRVTWKCGTKTHKEKKFRTHGAENPKCWSDEVGNIVAKEEHREKLKKLAEKCMTNKVQIGPALNPSDPTTFSNDAKDYKDIDGDLCFEVIEPDSTHVA